ncbi:MAG: cyclase family protein [Candidatus Methylomirabilota bacterium]|jgi:arylformamidase
MKLFDVTRPIDHAMPVYPGDPEVSVEPWLSIARGAPVNVSRLAMGSHTGTHVDAPAHLREDASGVDRLPLDALIGPTRVFDLAASADIDAAALRGMDLASQPRVLFKTRPADRGRDGTPEGSFAGLTEDAARLLVASGVRLVGVDAMTVDPLESSSLPAHRTLLDAGVIILEGLDLSAVPPGDYELLCLPLKIRHGDGAPARVVLRELAG